MIKTRANALAMMRTVAESEERRIDFEYELAEARSDLEKAANEYERWVALGKFGFWSVDSGDFEAAAGAAKELLGLADRYQTDWNYGNVIHKCNLIQGRIALRRGDVETAKEHLLAAGRTRGSPQLDSYGPNMMLARELLEVGEREAVLQYLELCGVFWKCDVGCLDIWRDLIKQGRTPNFSANLVF